MRDIGLFGLSVILLLAYASAANDPNSVQPRVVYAYALETAPVPSYPVVVAEPADSPEGVSVPEGYTYWKTVWAKVTAYDPSRVSCGNSADGFTSIMHDAWRMDGCAVDPTAIPYNSLVWIPSVGFRKADDTGAAMKKSWRQKGIHHIDLRMMYPNQARKWGIKWMQVHLFKKKAL